MELRWTEGAANDLEHIANFLFEHAPGRAAELVRQIYDSPSALVTFPYRGRPGKKRGTRELVLSPLPYIVVYQICRQHHPHCSYPPWRAEVALERFANCRIHQARVERPFSAASAMALYFASA